MSGWRNAYEGEECPLERARIMARAAQGAQSKSAAWSHAQRACAEVDLDPAILGNGRWPDLGRLEAAIGQKEQA